MTDKRVVVVLWNSYWRAYCVECNYCGPRPVTEFWKCSARKCGYFRLCKRCSSEAQKRRTSTKEYRARRRVREAFKWKNDIGGLRTNRKARPEATARNNATYYRKNAKERRLAQFTRRRTKRGRLSEIVYFAIKKGVYQGDRATFIAQCMRNSTFNKLHNTWRDSDYSVSTSPELESYEHGRPVWTTGAGRRRKNIWRMHATKKNATAGQ